MTCCVACRVREQLQRQFHVVPVAGVRFALARLPEDDDRLAHRALLDAARL